MYKINTESIGDVKKFVWHYRKDSKDSKEYGPFTYEDIVEMVKKGELGPDDYVLKFGNKKFIKAFEVQGLFDAIPVPVEKQEEQVEMVEVVEEQISECTEEAKEEAHLVFDNRMAHGQAKHGREPSGLNIAIIIGGILVLGLIAWGIILLF